MEKGFIVSLILAAIVGVFALSNSEKVEIDFIFTQIIVSQAIVIFLSAFAGAVIVAFLGWVKDLKLKKEIRNLNKKVDEVEEEKRFLQDTIVKKEEQIKSLYEREVEIYPKE